MRRPPKLHVSIDEGSGPAIVLVHGIASSPVTFEHVDAIAATLARLRIHRPFTLVGHSLGTILGARFAATHPRLVDHLVMVSPPLYLDPKQIGDPLLRARVGGYLALYGFVRTHQAFTLRAAAHIERLLPIEKAMDITAERWVPFVKTLEHCIESQTTVTDMVSTTAPIDVVVGDLDEFHAPGSLDGVRRLSNVHVTVSLGNDHLIRPSMAQTVADVIAGRHEQR